jgi:hypothetical protein
MTYKALSSDVEIKILHAVKNIQENDGLFLLLRDQKRLAEGKCYGLMVYDLCYINNNALIEYKIIYADNNYIGVGTCLKKQILDALETKKQINILFYETTDNDPRYISYNTLMSSKKIPCVGICVNNPRKEKLCKFIGNKRLQWLIYNCLDFLKEYDTYRDNLRLRDKTGLEKIFEETFSKKSTYKLFKKHRMFKKLLQQKKREFIKNY